MKKMYALQQITLEIIPTFQDLSELKAFLEARNLEDEKQRIVKELWDDYVKFCRTTPDLKDKKWKDECHKQSKERTSKIVNQPYYASANAAPCNSQCGPHGA